MFGHLLGIAFIVYGVVHSLTTIGMLIGWVEWGSNHPSGELMLRLFANVLMYWCAFALIN